MIDKSEYVDGGLDAGNELDAVGDGVRMRGGGGGALEGGVG